MAARTAVAAATEVLPTPPLPVTSRMRVREGLLDGVPPDAVDGGAVDGGAVDGGAVDGGDDPRG
jgi:hypothetical protein